MTAPLRSRRRRVSWLDRLLMVAALGLGGFQLLSHPEVLEQLAQVLRSVPPNWTFYLAAAAAVLFACAGVLLSGAAWPAWHAIANLAAEKRQRPLQDPWVIDGDTIDDRATGVRYRLANVDAPETGDNAKCYRERWRGELATRAAIALVRRARRVAVRRTWRRDRHGRRVALVLVDGVDLGETLMKRGLARPWRGRRERWCGPDGGLATLAQVRGAAFDCATCRSWRRT